MSCWNPILQVGKDTKDLSDQRRTNLCDQTGLLNWSEETYFAIRFSILNSI